MRRPYYGWVVAAASFLGTFVVFGLSYSFGVFLERIVEAFGGSRGLSSLAFGVQTLALYVGASVLGVLIDRYGTRRMLLFGALLSPLTAELFGRDQINAVFGLLSMAFAVPGLIASAAAGASYDRWGSYEPAFLVAGLAALVGACAVWLAGRRA